MSNDQLPIKLFYKFYVLLVLCIIVIGSSLDYIIDHFESNQELNYLIKTYKPSILMISDQLSRVDHSLWPQKIAKISQDFDIKLSLYKTEDFSYDQSFMSALTEQSIVGLFDNNNDLSLYFHIPNSQNILELSTFPHHFNNHSQWVTITFYILIAMVVFLIIHPFARQLLRLKAASTQFGQGDFSTRLTMPKNSSLYPIADAFDTMTQEIETLMLRQRDLTNGVSHELRTPLARLKFSFESVESDCRDPVVLQSIDEMREDVKELEQLINEMLRYAEVNHIEDFIKKNIPILPLIEHLMLQSKTEHILLTKKLAHDINENTIINADEHFLFRALSNIMRNALSFAKSRCEIATSIHKKDLIVTIADDGPGIDDQHKDRLFDAFFTINHNQRKEGFGLGLAIAHNIIKKHRGTIELIDHPFNGACFRITLPLM